jgi:group I intron endonuclease
MLSTGNKIAGIYLIEIEGHRYIGQSADMRVRWQDHLSDLKKQRHKNIILQRLFNKYGQDYLRFKVLKKLSSSFLTTLNPKQIRKILSILEQTYFNIYNPDINLCPTPESKLGWKATKEQREGMSMANSKTYQFLDEENNLVEIKNLSKYARENGVSQPNLWMLSQGVKKEYAGLKCLPEVYQKKQAELNLKLEKKKDEEWLYPNMCFSKQLGRIKYRVFLLEKRKQIINAFFINRKDGLECGLILNQILAT